MTTLFIAFASFATGCIAGVVLISLLIAARSD